MIILCNYKYLKLYFAHWPHKGCPLLVLGTFVYCVCGIVITFLDAFLYIIYIVEDFKGYGFEMYLFIVFWSC